MKLSELETLRATKMTVITALVDARDQAARDFTEAEATQFDALEAEVKALNTSIQREKNIEALNIQKALDKASKPTPEAKAAKDFSWNRAINQIIGHKNLDGLEGEMNEEAEREMKAAGIVKSGNVAIPSFLMGFKGVTQDGVRNSNIMGQQRDLTAAGSSTGDELVEDLKLGHIFALNIAPKVISTLGATVLPGLTSDVHFTKSGTATSVWATEVAASTETTPSTARITMTPKRLTGYTEISKTLLVQAPGIVNAIVSRELETSTNVALDAAAYNGSGAAGQPTGLLLMASGMNVNAATTIDREALINMEQLIAEDNGDIGMMKFVTTPGLRAMLKNQRTDAGSGFFVWTDQNTLIGYDSYATNNMPSTGGAGAAHAIILGVWDQLLIAQFGGLDLLVDPFSLSLTNMIRMVINTNWDINTRHQQAFCYNKVALLS